MCGIVVLKLSPHDTLRQEPLREEPLLGPPDQSPSQSAFSSSHLAQTLHRGVAVKEQGLLTDVEPE